MQKLWDWSKWMHLGKMLAQVKVGKIGGSPNDIMARVIPRESVIAPLETGRISSPYESNDIWYPHENDTVRTYMKV